MTEILKTVDEYINNLNYDSRNILVNNSSVPTYKKEDGKLLNDGTFLVIKKKQCSVKDSTSELTYMDTIATRLYPGTKILNRQTNEIGLLIKTWKNEFADRSIWFTTCVDKKGKRYHIKLDEIVPQGGS